LVSSCSGGSKSPASPSAPSGLASKPAAEAPADGAQLDNVRPTLTVANITSSGSGARTYEFQISDNSAFTSGTISSPAVAEDPSGKTRFTLAQDLQPTTKYYWHARLVQGSSRSDWSETRTFMTKLVGYNRPGALYDPLIHGETLGSIGGSGNVTWMPGEGVRFNDERAFVVYELAQTFSSGEISVEATGLNPDGPCCKPRIFSILDRVGAIASSSPYSINVQYRGKDGSPDNAIAWKVVLADNANALEPSTAKRFDSVVILDASKVYLWQGFWTPTSFRLVVKEGGLSGPAVYDYEVHSTTGTTNWNPAKMFAFLGTNNGNFVPFDGTRAGMTLRNLWVGNTPRPANLGH
jgi:hypothetical protein